MSSYISSLGGEVNYTNNTLGLFMKLPSEIKLDKESAELRKYELSSGEDKLGQEYKHYQINFSSNKASSTYIKITAMETPYKTITEWLEKDLTRGGDFPEDTVEFEQKNMFNENVLFGFDNWYRSQSTPEDKRSSEYVYLVKNNLLYKIELHDFSTEERYLVWKNIKLINI